MSEITDKDILLAILAMDSYNRGYAPGIDGLSDEKNTAIGAVTIDRASSSDPSSLEFTNGFYAVSYNTNFGTVISYRGTDNPDPLTTADCGSDLWRGWVSGAGFPAGQSALAFDFYEAVTGVDGFDGEAQGVTLTGHSLGGGLVGLVASISGDKGVLFWELAA